MRELHLPRSCWEVFDGLCELQDGRWLTVYGGQITLTQYTGLHPRTVERALKRLQKAGVIHNAEPSIGGRMPADGEGASKGKANGYELGRLAMQPRSSDRGSTPVKRPPLGQPNPGQTTGVQPRSNDRPMNPGQTTGVQPRSNDRPSPPRLLRNLVGPTKKQDASGFRRRDRVFLSPDALSGLERINPEGLRGLFGDLKPEKGR